MPPRRPQKGPKTTPETANMAPREPKMTQNEAQDAPKRFQEAPDGLQKAIPKRKTKKGPNQDDPKTVLDRPRADYHQFSPLPGAIWEPKTEPKSIPKRSKIEANNQEAKKPSKMILDPSWGDLVSILAPS